MRNYILRRIVLTIPVIALVTFGAFALLRMIPGSVVDLKAGTAQSEEDQRRLEKQFGLDKSIPEQFVLWVTDLARGDLGESLWTTERVSTEVKRRFPPTLQLALMASVMASTIALVAGTTAAIHQDSWLDRSIQFITITGLAIPNFVLATLLFSLPAIWWGKVIPEGYVPLIDHPAENVQKMIFPALILGAAQAAILTRLVRSTMLEVLRQDYVRTAWAKGLAARHVILRHALRNALLPVMTVWGLQLAAVLGGTVIMETMFRIPGMGTGTLNAVQQRDYGLAQVLILIFGLVYIFTSLVIDILYAYVDPRVRYT